MVEVIVFVVLVLIVMCVILWALSTYVFTVELNAPVIIKALVYILVIIVCSAFALSKLGVVNL